MRSTNKWAQTAYQLIAVIASVSFSYSSLISIERNGIDHHIIYKNHRRSIDWNKSIKRYRRSSPICDDYLIVRVRIAHVDERSIHVRYKLRPPSTHDQCERLMERQKHYPGKSSSFPSQQRVVERRLFQLDITTAVIKCFVDRHLFKESQRKISDLYKEVEYVFDDLKPFTKYRITFDLYDELRRRIPITSFQFDAVTKQSVPSEPLDVMASIHNSTAIRVSWRPPKYHNGEIRSYGVKYLAFGDESKKGKIDLTANHRSVTITSLLPETKYILSVFANTIAGDGKHSSEIEVTTPSLKPLTAIGFNAYIEHSNKKGAIANGNSGLLIVVHWTYSRKAFILPEFFNLWVWRRSFPLTSNSQKKPPSYLIAGPIRIERRATSSYSYSMKAAYGYCYEFSLESRTRKFRGERNATTRLCTWNMSPIYLQKAVSKLNISIDTNKYEAYHDDNSNVNPQTFPQISSKFRSSLIKFPHLPQLTNENDENGEDYKENSDND
ncbi:hypothetical protein SNEBB_007519 [Seison nebaliae]|nr:hypothetical protein SNEBB_007519 [Seison nebaliae]